MKVSELTRKALRYRRFVKKWEAEGYEEVGEGGGRLWELYRGGRTRQQILDVKIAPGGKKLFVKIGDPPFPLVYP
jgi:hypothetical protein